MNKLEVIELLKILKRTYPAVDVSAEGVAHYEKYLLGFPFETARENVEKHIMTDRFPPTIADIRGRLGDQLENQKSKMEAESHIAQMELSHRCNVPPPIGYWEHTRKLIRGELHE